LNFHHFFKRRKPRGIRPFYFFQFLPIQGLNITKLLHHAQAAFLDSFYTVTAFPRLASPEELAWVHTPDYIEQVAQTAGKPLFAFDMDTQTTEKSYETARLAVGGVFSLIDAICNREAKRGFAFIRPPGHHAEPDKAMGFCLFTTPPWGPGT